MADTIIGLWGFSDSGGSCGSSSASGSPPLDDDPPFELPPPKVQPIKKIRNVRKSPIHKCAVCGDRPTGYHYDVLSCNGCKTFFRRTVINQRRFICSRGGNCEFTKDFRCACRACRFAKCVTAGMNPKAIQFPTQQIQLKEEQDSPDEQENNEQQVLLQQQQQQQQVQMAVVPMLKQVKTEDVDHMMALDMILHREAAVKNFRDSECPTFIYPDIPLEDLLNYHCVLGKNKDGSTSPTQMLSLDLYKNNPVRFWMITDLFLTVEFAKTFTEFQSLSQNDRSEILHKVGGAIQILQQSYYTAMQHSDSITFPDGVNALYYQMVTMKRRQYEMYYRECYCKPVDIIRRLELSLPEFVMFKTIAIFSNELDISEEGQRVVKEQREKLVTIFRKYLIGQYGMQKGTEKLASCLLTIATFIDIAEKRRSYLHCIDLMNRCQVSKLAKGIYLKQTAPC